MLVYLFRSVFGLWLAVVITDMQQDKDTRRNDRPANSDTASDLTSFLEQLVRILLGESTSTQHSRSSDDVVFRVAHDRRRSSTNILPYRNSDLPIGAASTIGVGLSLPPPCPH